MTRNLCILQFIFLLITACKKDDIDSNVLNNQANLNIPNRIFYLKNGMMHFTSPDGNIKKLISNKINTSLACLTNDGNSIYYLDSTKLYMYEINTSKTIFTGITSKANSLQITSDNYIVLGTNVYNSNGINVNFSPSFNSYVGNRTTREDSVFYIHSYNNIRSKYATFSLSTDYPVPGCSHQCFPNYDLDLTFYPDSLSSYKIIQQGGIYTPGQTPTVYNEFAHLKKIKISPDGKYLGFIQLGYNTGSNKSTYSIVIYDLSTQQVISKSIYGIDFSYDFPFNNTKIDFQFSKDAKNIIISAPDSNGQYDLFVVETLLGGEAINITNTPTEDETMPDWK